MMASLPTNNRVGGCHPHNDDYDDAASTTTMRHDNAFAMHSQWKLSNTMCTFGTKPTTMTTTMTDRTKGHRIILFRHTR